MKEDDSSFNNSDDEKLNLKEHDDKKLNLKEHDHDKNMNKMIETSHSIVKKIKEMSKDISSDLKSQNKILNEIGLSLSRTNSHLKKNNSKIDEFLSKTSNFSLVMLAIIQIIAIVFLFSSLHIIFSSPPLLSPFFDNESLSDIDKFISDLDDSIPIFIYLIL